MTRIVIFRIHDLAHAIHRDSVVASRGGFLSRVRRKGLEVVVEQGGRENGPDAEPAIWPESASKSADVDEAQDATDPDPAA